MQGSCSSWPSKKLVQISQLLIVTCAKNIYLRERCPCTITSIYRMLKKAILMLQQIVSTENLFILSITHHLISVLRQKESAGCASADWPGYMYKFLSSVSSLMNHSSFPG